MKGGLLNWEYTWSPTGRGESFAISYQLFAHRLNVTQAVVRMAITPSADMNVKVVNVIDGYSAVRTEFVDSGEDGHAIYSSVSPVGVPDVTAYIYATISGSKEVDIESLKLVPNPPYVHTNRSSIAQAADIKLRAGQKSIVTKFVGVASSDGFENPKQVAKEASSNAADIGYDALLKSHIGEWATVFTDDSVDDFAVPKTGRLPLDDHIIESAITSVTNPFYLLQTIVSDNAIHAARNAPIHQGSVAVGGLTSDSYGGLIFWDADIWMQPGLVTAFPQAAQSFTNYRLIKYGQAIENTKIAFASSKNQTRFSQGAAIYPWTSGRFGNCTGTGPCFDYQYHLNGDIGLQMINNWVTTGDTDHFKEKLFPVYNSIAILYADLLEKNGTKWTLTNMTDPYAAKQSPDGPGMTYAIFSIVANEISPSGCSAYTYAQYSYAPYIRAPFFQFSEQLIDNWSRNGGTHPAYPFLTGNGGANQVALFGYLGLRLLPDFVVHLDPNLPPQIPHLSYRTFYWHGWPLKAASNYTHTTIQRAPNTQPLPTADKKFAGAPIPVHVGPESNVTVYLLPASGILTIPNRQIGSHATFPGNMVQCQPASSPDEYEPGQFPIAAVDGAASTKWQPKRANATSSLTVSFPDDEISELITGFGFDWAQAPPESIAVVLHNTPLSKPTQQQVSQSFSPSSASGALSVPSTPGAITVTAFPSITLSNPYNPATTDLNIIARYAGNTTNVTLARAVPATRFATLFIWGNQALDNVDRRAGNGSGATVAEWSILRSLRAGQSGTTAGRGGEAKSFKFYPYLKVHSMRREAEIQTVSSDSQLAAAISNRHDRP
ncbi:acid trehalase [Histoplasma capsulatum H143]|uniref:alpha,alpha-trehalase n=1 Tax=Ajellomyces capsulatus (strain H143) TaxID=544712 RepID=C6H5E3_AJECH|nr:acid trehalase [Histoplasma capsulatum H143]